MVAASDTGEGCSRRQYLAGACGVAGAMAAPALFSDSASAVSSTQGGAKYGEARISPAGRRRLAAYDRFQQQQGNGLQFDTRVDAVEDLGCDPNGGTPVQDTLNSKIKDGMLVVFPQGTYVATGEVNPSPDRFGIVGEGYQKASRPPKLGKSTVTFKIQTSQPIKLFNIGPVSQGLFGNFVIDQRKRAAHAGVTVRSSGNVRVRDIRTVGAQTAVGNGDSTPFFFEPFAEDPDSLIVLKRCIARGGGIPGTKNIGGSAGIGVFGRSGEDGRIVLKDCVIENMPDNGIYGSRTTAKVDVLGGLYRNNDVSQVRVNGDARVDGVDIVIDEKNYTGLKSKSYGRERGPGWPNTNGLKIETEPSISSTAGTVVADCNIVGASVSPEGGVGGLVNIWDSAGAVSLSNCRFTNAISETTSLVTDPPSASAPNPLQVTLKNSVIQGTGAGGPAINIRNRPRSLVTDVCLSYPGASQGDIRGARTSNVSLGPQCKSGAGLKAPGKVGSGGNLSSLPAPTVSYNGSAAAGGGGGTAANVKMIILGAAALVALIIALAVIGVPAGVVGLGAVVTLALSYILNDD